jgi:uncharacterized protein YjbI with pentapeptide repeats
MQQRSRGPITIGVLGECNSGKSSLVNLIVGKGLSPIESVPNTVRPVLLRAGAAERIRLHGAGGAREAPLERLGELFARAGELGLVPAELEDVPLVELLSAAPRLRYFSLLDGQGFNNPDWSAQPTRDVLGLCDVLVWCTRAEAAWRGTEAEEWARIGLARAAASMLLVTHADNLNRLRERDKVLSRLEGQLKGAFSTFAVASLTEAERARRGLEVADAGLWQRSGFGRVQAELDALLRRHSLEHGIPLVMPGADLRGDALAFLGIGPEGLREADLEGADLSGTLLRSMNLAGADLRRARLVKADLGHSDLSGADLSGADLSGASLADVRADGARLRGVKLGGAFMRGATLRGADLGGATLDGADLRNVDLEGAELEGATFEGAFVLGTLLEDARR